MPHADTFSGRKPQAVRSALEVLRTVVASGPGITAARISVAVDLPPATTYRILNLLVAEEYLVRLSDLRGFALGARYAELAPLGATELVSDAALTALDGLRRRTGLPTSLAVYQNTSFRYVAQDATERRLSGGVAPAVLHATAIGKLLLAELPNWRHALPGPLKAWTPHTIVDAESLHRELARIRANRYSIQVNEVLPQTACVAAPVHDHRGLLTGGISVTGTDQDISSDRAGLIDAVKTAAAALTGAQAPLTTGI